MVASCAVSWCLLCISVLYVQMNDVYEWRVGAHLCKVRKGIVFDAKRAWRLHALYLSILYLLFYGPAGEKACLWAFNFFFYNKKMKRILYIGVKAVSKLAADDEKVSENGSRGLALMHGPA